MRTHVLLAGLVLSLTVGACSKETPAPAAPAAGTGAAPAAGTGSGAPAEASAPAAAEASAPAPAAAPAPPPPTGETCADAIPLAIALNAGATASGSLNGHTNDVSDLVAPTGYEWTGADLFYKVELAATDVLQVALHDGVTFDGGSWVFTDCANPAASAIAGADTSTGAAFYQAQAATAGTYYIAVDAFAGGMTGDFTLVAHRISENPPMPPVAGETCATAALLTLPQTFSGTLNGAANDFQEVIPQTGFAWDGVDQFYAFDLAAGQTLNINLDDFASVDAGWYLFTDCNNIVGTTIAGLDSGNNTEVTTVTAPTAGRYILAVDSWQGATGGSYMLNVF
jgi:hypothetical protein